MACGVTHNILHLTRDTYFSAYNSFALVFVSSHTVHTVAGRPTNDLWGKPFDTGSNSIFDVMFVHVDLYSSKIGNGILFSIVELS